MAVDKIQRGDVVSLQFTGYNEGKAFDSNVEADLKQLSSEAKAEPLIVCVGQGMIVKGFDAALEGKEVSKEYTIKVSAQEGFGERKRELVKTIPLRQFTEKKVNPYPGMVLALDDMLVRIITISGARVIADFNNPLAGKELEYRFTVVSIVQDEREKARALFSHFVRFVPNFEVNDKVVIKGPKVLEVLVKAFSEKFKSLMGKELGFIEEEQKAAVSSKDSASTPQTDQTVTAK